MKKDFFGNPEYNANARNSDPETSKAAGANIRAEKAVDRSKVYRIFFNNDPTPLADFQLEQQLGGAMNGKWRKRRSDLFDEGVIVRVDMIVNPHTGREVIRWGLRVKRAQQVANATQSFFIHENS